MFGIRRQVSRQSSVRRWSGAIQGTLSYRVVTVA